MVSKEVNTLVPTQSTSAADEAKVQCIIRDMTNPEVQTKFNLNMPASMPAKDLVAEVGKRLGYEPGSFKLAYEKESIGSNEVDMDICDTQPIGSVCENCGNGKRNNFNVTEKDGVKLIKSESTEASTGTSDHSSFVSNQSSYTSPTYSSWSGAGSYSYAAALSDTGYVGLVNQAMTCYLNSLLQTLYMTPEFRNAVYRWEYSSNGEDQQKSIPYQLQRLFLQLQTSKKKAIETTDITKSFGWDSSEAWQQHDVQELMRVMFDALERKWKKTGQANLINELYQGKMKDYVKCLECGNESAREDHFLDIPLTIKPFGSSKTYSSVEESMQAFVEPETLEGSNQYFCEKCDKKCDAHKGLKFTSFPYLLTLQLKRFDFDYTTMHRIKLNDTMTFPQILNLNDLVESLKAADGSEDGGGSNQDADGGGQGASAAEPVSDEGIEMGGSASGSNLSNEEASTNDKNARLAKSQGPYEYELYSIMIHSGSAAGGHYYAYIKSFKDGQWYSFNDQHVSTISMEDIRKTYGGSSSSRGYYSATYASSTNAYMLVYRRIDKERNEDFTTKDDFPAHLSNEFKRQQDKDENERKQREIERSTCKIKLFCFHPSHKKQLESRLEVHKHKTLKEATEIAWKQFELDNGVVPLDRVRLVKYDEIHDYIDRSYDGDDDMEMEGLLGGVKSAYIFDLLLEVRREDQTFKEYKPGGLSVKVYMVDLEAETITPTESLRVMGTDTVLDLKNTLAQQFDVSAENMRVVLEKYCNDLKPLLMPGKTLKNENFIKSNKVFVECSGQEKDVDFFRSKFYKLLDRYENTIRIHMALPRYVKFTRYPQPNRRVNEAGDAIIEYPPENSTLDVANNPSKAASDVDEGIGEDSDASSLDNNGGGGDVKSCDSQSCGPLVSGANNKDIHSMISESIHKQNLLNSMDSQKYSSPPDGTETAECSDNQSKVHTTTAGSLEAPDDEGEAGGSATGTEAQDASVSSQMITASSPVENAKDFSEKETSENWDIDDDNHDQEYRKYLTASLHINAETQERSLEVCVDKRITLKALKEEIEPYVGTTADYFKIYRMYGNNQELECTKLTETLTSFGDDCKLTVRIGRALKKGEYRVKIYELQLSDPDPSKYLTDAVVGRGLTVPQLKKEIIDDVHRICKDLSQDKCRLRKKSWRNPSTIYMDSQHFGDDDIRVIDSSEFFIERLSGPEPKTGPNVVCIYVRRWRPSEHVVGPFEEIALESRTSTIDELRQALSKLSGIEANNIDFAKAKGTFPCEMSVLEVQNELEWNPNVTHIDTWPLSLCDDGTVLYYRDKTEEYEELDAEKKKELQTKENIRLSKYSSRVSSYSPRKERALKIYTDDTPSPKPSSVSFFSPSPSTEGTATVAHPDID